VAALAPAREEEVLKVETGLIIVPNLLPPEVQWILLDRLVHRDLSDPHHLTNLHPHYEIPYPRKGNGSPDSFFSYPINSTVEFPPKDANIHNPLNIRQVLNKRLHWETLGGQYDWTSRVYPEQAPPQFPSDIANFLHALFPKTEPQAAIVNFYTPGDTMMMHRDVSEEVNKGLVSVSFGCDALFMIAPNDIRELEEKEDAGEKQYLLLRLRSGDAIYMTGESRYAWHGVPKVVKGTCPEYLADWPAKDAKYEDWKGWMRNKRINLNVRQMKE
jgi:DNA alkylation damage repair protein AlkB